MKLYAKKNKKVIKEEINDINLIIEKAKEYLKNGFVVRIVFYE